MNVFEAVRDSVTARQAAESYGIKVNRNGMACCPFHDDKHPSMKLSKGEKAYYQRIGRPKNVGCYAG